MHATKGDRATKHGNGFLHRVTRNVHALNEDSGITRADQAGSTLAEIIQQVDNVVSHKMEKEPSCIINNQTLHDYGFGHFCPAEEPPQSYFLGMLGINYLYCDLLDSALRFVVPSNYEEVRQRTFETLDRHTGAYFCCPNDDELFTECGQSQLGMEYPRGEH